MQRAVPTVLLLVASMVLAGCLNAPLGAQSTDHQANLPTLPGAVSPVVAQAMTLTRSVVSPAVGLAQDLYEPSVTVGSNGTIYVAGHVTGAASTGTPAYVSNDGGATWKQLPFAGPASAPGPVQGAAPPPGDEGFIVPAEAGHAYMVDINTMTFPVVGWCGQGANECYYQPNALDRAAGAQAQANGDCQAAGLTDRPWAAYANHTLLLLNNDGNGVVQVGIEHMPQANAVNPLPATWNLCAGGTGFIPGVPAIRADGLFAVPHIEGGDLAVVLGHASDLANTNVTKLFKVDSTGTNASFGGGANFGWSAFDGAGNLYVGALTASKEGAGTFDVAYSSDGASTFHTSSFSVGSAIGFLWIAGNPSGPGALVTWIQDGSAPSLANVYAAHLMADGNGTLHLTDKSLVAQSVLRPCGDLMGSAVGPDGRAYVSVFNSAKSCTDTPLGNPLSVYIQQSGPTLPTSLAAPESS